MTKTIQDLITIAIEGGIIKLNFQDPVTFKSGIQSPIYCDWRRAAEYPDLMILIGRSFNEKIKRGSIGVVMGVAVGALAHSERLAFQLNLPSAYVRPGSEAKDYGMKKIIEGADISGKRVLLIEDLFSTGGSAFKNIEIIKKAKPASIKLCAIFSYDMPELQETFANSGIEPESLIKIKDILPFLKEKLNSGQYESLVSWVNNPKEWSGQKKNELA